MKLCWPLAILFDPSFLRFPSPVFITMDASQKILLEAISADTSTQLSTLKTEIRKDLLAVMDSKIDDCTESIMANTEKLIKAQAEKQDSLMKKADENFTKLSGTVSSLVADLEKVKIDASNKGSGSGGSISDPWAGFGRGDDGGRKKIKVGDAGYARPGPFDIFDEATAKDQLRIKVSNFKGNSTKEYRIKSLKEFLESLGHIQGRYEVEAYKDTGETAWIVFDTQDQAKLFIKDHKKSFNNFQPVGANATDRRIKFSGWMAPRDKRKKAATGVFGKILKGLMDGAQMSLGDDDKFFWDGWRGVVNYKGFAIAAVSVDEEMSVKIYPRTRNIDDTEIENLSTTVDAAIKEFTMQWRQ